VLERAAVVIIALLAAGNALGQAETDTTGDEPSLGVTMADLLAKLEAERGPASGGMESPATLAPDVACVDIGDEATQTRCWRAFEAYFDYYESGFEHRRRVFAWQHFSSRVIFVGVFVLVGAGLFFAWLQFRRDGRERRDGESAPGHEVAIGPSGVKVSSPVLGVVILTLSLAFFYLYLIFVYPIQEIL
jgi:hypothetical protein